MKIHNSTKEEKKLTNVLYFERALNYGRVFAVCTYLHLRLAVDVVVVVLVVVAIITHFVPLSRAHIFKNAIFSSFFFLCRALFPHLDYLGPPTLTHIFICSFQSQKKISHYLHAICTVVVFF